MRGLFARCTIAGLDGRMNLFTRAAVLQLLKVLAPFRIDALGIGQKLFVQGFDIRSVTARERRRGQQLAKAGSHTGEKSLWTQGPGATKGRYVSPSRPHRKGESVANRGECYVKEIARSPRAARTSPGPRREWSRPPCQTAASGPAGSETPRPGTSGRTSRRQSCAPTRRTSGSMNGLISDAPREISVRVNSASAPQRSRIRMATASQCAWNQSVTTA